MTSRVDDKVAHFPLCTVTVATGESFENDAMLAQRAYQLRRIAEDELACGVNINLIHHV
jgi:hypothetical protein